MELVKKVMELVVGEVKVESLGLRVERVERIWLNFLLLLDEGHLYEQKSHPFDFQ